jgi:soluble lytic murein transglycosylase
MATLPDATALGEQSLPVPQSSGVVAQYQPPNWRQTGMAGQYVSEGGRDIDRAAQEMMSANAQQDSIVAQSAANALEQARIKQQFDPKTGWANAKEGRAVGQQFIDENTANFTDTQQQIRDSLTNDFQKKVFDQHAQQQMARFQSAIYSHQAQETEKFNDATANGNVTSALQTASLDPASGTSIDRSGNLVDRNVPAMMSAAQIEGTIDDMGKRKGWPAVVTDNAKRTALSALYSARIQALNDGVPGAVQASPYLAEKLFESTQGQMDEKTRLFLGNQVLKSVKGVQARDTAQAIVSGHPPTAPLDLTPAVTGKPLQAVVETLESGGRDFGPDGKILTSDKGAQGSMQVMPATASNPGYGVRPAADDSPGELARVGRDYLGAMSARFEEPALVLAAYNAGPGRVDGWIKQFGDPRSGAISPADWAAKIPLAETKNYVTAGLAKLGTQPQTASTLKVDLYSRAEQARAIAEQQYPGDTAYADSVVSRVLNYGNMVIADQRAKEQGAHEALVNGMIGTKPDGSDAPQTIDALLADPQQKANWDQATPEVKKAIQDRFAAMDKKSANVLTKDGMSTYYALLGKAGTDPEGFTKEDLSSHFGEIPDHLLLGLMQAQKSINAKDAATQAKGEQWTKARSVVDDMLKPIGLGQTAKPNSANAKTTEQFYGRLQEAMQDFHDQNGKWPQQQDLRKMAGGLLMQGKESGGTLWDSSKRSFETDPGKFYVPLPAARTGEYSGAVDRFSRSMGRKPATESELQRWYSVYRQAGGQ